MMSQHWYSKAALICAIAGALGIFCAGRAVAQETWADEILSALTFYKTSYPASDFAPYVNTAETIRDGLRRGEQPLVHAQTERLLRMLRTRAYGIDDVAADELANLVVSLQQSAPPAVSSTGELGIGAERPMSVPDHVINTPYEGGPSCQQGGCDYWSDNVFDPGAS
jgi:hypothetical protein